MEHAALREGSDTSKLAYEILDFKKDSTLDFKISTQISGFRRDFIKISEDLGISEEALVAHAIIIIVIVIIHTTPGAKKNKKIILPALIAAAISVAIAAAIPVANESSHRGGMAHHL